MNKYTYARQKQAPDHNAIPEKEKATRYVEEGYVTKHSSGVKRNEDGHEKIQETLF